MAIVGAKRENAADADRASSEVTPDADPRLFACAAAFA
jgi:hypothetical protein